MICDHCGRTIRGTVQDPVYSISAGVFHGNCMLKYAASSPEKKKPDGRLAAAKSRWASMTPEQRQEQVRKMQEGRKRHGEGSDQ